MNNDISSRMKTICGHIDGVGRMIAEDRDVEEIILQIAAVECSLGIIKRKLIFDLIDTKVKKLVSENTITTKEVDNDLAIVKTLLLKRSSY